MKISNMIPLIYRYTLYVSLFLLLVACSTPDGSATPTQATLPDDGEERATIDGTGGYPAPLGLPTRDRSYPASQLQEELLEDPPDPELILPEAQGRNGVIGGVLIREVTGEGFIPLMPHELILAEVVYDSDGNAGLISYDEDSPRAKTFDTGIFLFEQVPPGLYGFVVNLAISEFPLRNEGGSEILVTVEPGSAIDLGQIFVQLP